MKNTEEGACVCFRFSYIYCDVVLGLCGHLWLTCFAHCYGVFINSVSVIFSNVYKY